MAYINRKNTEDAIRKYADQKHSNGEQIEYINGILKAISVINEQPAADVVEVVRCKDCKYFHCHSAVDRMFYCQNHKGLKCVTAVEEDSFCSYGAKVDGGKNNER